MRSLRRQLTTSLLGAFGLILGGGGLATYWAMRDSLFDQFDRGLEDKARAVITAAVPREDTLSVYFSDRFLRSFDDAVATEYFQVFDPKGKSVQRSDSLHNDNLPLQFGPPHNPEVWNMTLPSGKTGRAIGIEFRVTPRMRDERPPIRAIVVVAAELEPILSTLRDLRLILILTWLGALGLTVLAVWRTLVANLRPVQAVSSEAARIDAHSLDQRLPVETLPLELRPVTAKLNALLDRLQASFERERRFSADLAHELRTPIAELRSLAEVAIKWPEERDPETDAIALAIAEQLESRVTTLLQLARAEQGHVSLKIERIDLVEACESALRPFRHRASERALRLQAMLPEAPLYFETDSVLFHAILGNLLDNAVTYAPADSDVFLRLFGRAPEGFQIEVQNTAPELVGISMERLFDRFWRQDPARTESHHAGLGLSLVRSYTHLLGLTIEAHFDSESARLTIQLQGI